MDERLREEIALTAQNVETTLCNAESRDCDQEVLDELGAASAAMDRALALLDGTDLTERATGHPT